MDSDKAKKLFEIVIDKEKAINDGEYAKAVELREQQNKLEKELELPEKSDLKIFKVELNFDINLRLTSVVFADDKKQAEQEALRKTRPVVRKELLRMAIDGKDHGHIGGNISQIIPDFKVDAIKSLLL